MFEPDQYQLLDFGGGEKLERFGDLTVRRQSPSVGRAKADKSQWRWDLQFSRQPQPQWQPRQHQGQPWSVRHGNKQFLLKPSPAGQVGVFPEQAENWDWIERHRDAIKGLKAINLFAYTGGTTMQLADCGVEVTHVDAARPVVQWARKNAEASDLAGHAIRWIVDDAISYLQREIGRGSQYQIVVADPPSFGRGPKNSVWKIQRDLRTMLNLIAQVAPHPKMIILSSHTPEFRAVDLQRHVTIDLFGCDGNRNHRSNASIKNGGAKDAQKDALNGGQPLNLNLISQKKKVLASGECFRWSHF